MSFNLHIVVGQVVQPIIPLLSITISVFQNISSVEQKKRRNSGEEPSF